MSEQTCPHLSGSLVVSAPPPGLPDHQRLHQRGGRVRVRGDATPTGALRVQPPGLPRHRLRSLLLLSQTDGNFERAETSILLGDYKPRPRQYR